MNQAIIDFSKVTNDHTTHTIQIAESILSDCSIDVRALEIITRHDQFSVVDRFRGAKIEYVDMHSMTNPEVVAEIVRRRLERFVIERRSGVVAVISYHKSVLLTAGEFRSTGLNLRIGSFRTFDRPRQRWTGFKGAFLGQQPEFRLSPADFEVVENQWQSRFGSRWPNLKTVIDLLVGALKNSSQTHHTRAQLREILVRQDEQFRKQWGEQPGMISMIVQGAEKLGKIEVFSPNPGRPEFDKIRLRSEQINQNAEPSNSTLPKIQVPPHGKSIVEIPSQDTSPDTSVTEIANTTTTTATELSRRYQRIVAAAGRGPYSRIRHSFYKVIEDNLADLVNLPVNQFVRRAIDRLEAESKPIDKANAVSSGILENSTRSFNWRTLGDAMIRILLDSKVLSDEGGNAIEYSLKGRTTIVKQLAENWRDKADAIILLSVIREEPVSDLNFVDLGGLLFHSRNEDQFESRLLNLLQILVETNQIVEEYHGQVRIYKIKSE